jgi:hypothetical protein
MKETDAADDRSALPPVVTPEKWQRARDAALGRQETWEHSPAGWPQTPAYSWRLHDEYPPNDQTAAA